MVKLGAYVALVLLFAATTAVGQEQPRIIGSIDFYGYAGLNLDHIRVALPLHAGDRFPGRSATVEGITKAVTSVISRPQTDVAPVCCDAQGKFMIYVGLPGCQIDLRIRRDRDSRPGISMLPVYSAQKRS